MPTINTPITFSNAAKKIILEKSKATTFQHSNWGDEDLLTVRQEIREHYRTVQRLKCVYCKNPISHRSASGAHIEHIIAKSQKLNFIFEPKNLCVICPDCNEIKSKKDAANKNETPLENENIKRYPRSSGAFKVVHPHFDNYEDHIYKAGRLYVDLTTKGHWTIGACELNRFYRRFGVCEELIEDIDIITLEERFHDSETDPMDIGLLQENLSIG